MEKNKRKMGWEGVRDAVNNLSKEDLFNWLQDNLVFPDEWSLDTADARTLPDKIYSVLYEKSRVDGVRVLYEDEWPIDELVILADREADMELKKERKNIFTGIVMQLQDKHWSFDGDTLIGKLEIHKDFMIKEGLLPKHKNENPNLLSSTNER